MDKNQLDNNFEYILDKKKKALENKYSSDYLETINLMQLMFIGNYINGLKPKSKIREYKQYLLNYFSQFIYSNKELNSIEIVNAKKEYLEPLLSYLNKYHNFYTNNLLIYIRVTFGVILDLVIIIIGIAKFYYYIPFFTLTILLFSVIKQRKLKQQGKILYF